VHERNEADDDVCNGGHWSSLLFGDL
jgi:hypothetical protein